MDRCYHEGDGDQLDQCSISDRGDRKEVWCVPLLISHYHRAAQQINVKLIHAVFLFRTSREDIAKESAGPHSCIQLYTSRQITA